MRWSCNSRAYRQHCLDAAGASRVRHSDHALSVDNMCVVHIGDQKRLCGSFCTAHGGKVWTLCTDHPAGCCKHRCVRVCCACWCEGQTLYVGYTAVGNATTVPFVLFAQGKAGPLVQITQQCTCCSVCSMQTVKPVHKPCNRLSKTLLRPRFFLSLNLGWIFCAGHIAVAKSETPTFVGISLTSSKEMSGGLPLPR